MTVKPTVVGGSVRIDLREVPEGSHPVFLEAPEVALPLAGGGSPSFRNLGLEATLARQGSEFWLGGEVAGDLEADCDRCLMRFTRPIRAELELTALVGGPGGAEAETSAPGDVLRLPEGTQTLDLTEALREAVALEVPIKKLCKEDCRGICPSCGVNRNETNCECRTVEGDPRWEALRRLAEPSNPEE